ncbi:MAG: hypothetical protein ACFFAX_16165, partial [Promethearchaeota archaeon]
MTSHEEGRGQSLDDIFGDFAELELEHVTIEVDELKLALRPMVQRLAQAAAKAAIEMPKSLIPAQLKPPLGEYPGVIREITIGATKKEGGSRSNT